MLATRLSFRCRIFASVPERPHTVHWKIGIQPVHKLPDCRKLCSPPVPVGMKGRRGCGGAGKCRIERIQDRPGMGTPHPGGGFLGGQGFVVVVVGGKNPSILVVRTPRATSRQAVWGWWCKVNEHKEIAASREARPRISGFEDRRRGAPPARPLTPWRGNPTKLPHLPLGGGRDGYL